MVEAFRPERRFDWPIASFLVGYHLALLIGLPFYLLSPPDSIANKDLSSTAALSMDEAGERNSSRPSLSTFITSLFKY